MQVSYILLAFAFASLCIGKGEASELAELRAIERNEAGKESEASSLHHVGGANEADMEQTPSDHVIQGLRHVLPYTNLRDGVTLFVGSDL